MTTTPTQKWCDAAPHDMANKLYSLIYTVTCRFTSQASYGSVMFFCHIMMLCWPMLMLFFMAYSSHVHCLLIFVFYGIKQLKTQYLHPNYSFLFLLIAILGIMVSIECNKSKDKENIAEFNKLFHSIYFYSEKAWACDVNGITQRGRLEDGYIIMSAKREWLFIHTPIAELCNAIQITGQMPSRFYIIPLYDNLSNNISFNVISIFNACCWLCVTMVALVFCTCCHLWKTSQFVSDVMLNQKMKSGTVTRAIMWLLCEYGIEESKDWVFVAHFMNLFNTMMLMPCTDVHSEAPMSHFRYRRVGMGC